MNVLILGMDGYIGWSLGLHLAEKGNKVVGVDNFSRRRTIEEIGSWSATPIQSMEKRMQNAKAVYQDRLRFHEGDLIDYKFIVDVLKTTKPDVIVHLGEQPSAPYSMIDVEHAAYTQQNNVIGTLNLLFAMRDYSPDAHLLKLGCYSEDTQVLTRNGWKYFYELQYEDEVCCLDPASEEIRYDKPSNIVAYPYNGKMLRIDTSNVDFLITPNHRVVYRYLGSQYKDSVGTIHIATSEEVFSKNFAVPKSGNWNAEDVESFEVPSMEVRGVWGHYHTVTKQVFRMDKWLSFFGWFVAEGSVRRRNGEPTAVYLAQKSSSPKAEHLRKAVQELGLNFVESKLEDKRRPLVMSNFEISNNHLANYLAQFGTSENKFIPSELKNVSKRQLRILFDALMLGDGHVDKKTGSMYYHSKSEHLLGDVQEIAMKLGYGATICEHLREDRGFIEKYLCISRHPNGRASSRSQSWQKYKGVVYCCSVPTGVIMVRRNGKSAFSGNTMGEYGTPPVDIPEGFFEVEHNGRKAELMFPRYPGSFYHACYDDQTEVLTDNGWKYFSEVEAIDLLATLNLSTKEMQFQKPTAIHRYYYEGLMLHQKHRKIDLCVTPNHRVLFFWSRRYPKLQFREAAKVKGKQISEVTGAPWEEGIEQEYFTLPSCEYAQNYKGGMVKLERRMPMKNWLPFLGWYLSEGSVDHDPIGKDKHLSYRVALASDYRLEEAKQIFANIGYDASISGKQAIVCDKQLAMYLRRFGRSKEKFIPKEVKSLPRKDLLLLLENLFNGDGHCDSRGFRTYYTSSRRLADDVQEIALKCGYSANLSTARGHEYRVNVTKSRSGQINLVRARDEWINYRGYVYCATVPNETLLVRRNGKVVFSGNSKVHDTFNIMLACRIWGLRSTDVMQGVVYGTRTHEINPSENPEMCTRFDFDEVFGTAINRYCAEAVIGYPLTVYGKGGQTRGFLALVDSIQCLTLISENPPEKGEYRVFNQIDETYDVTGLANTVKKVGERKGLMISVEHVPNPRKEAEEHHYKVEAKHLRNLGFKQTRALEQEVDLMLDDLMMCKERIKEKEYVIAPKTSWESGRYLVTNVDSRSGRIEKPQN